MRRRGSHRSRPSRDRQGRAGASGIDRAAIAKELARAHEPLSISELAKRLGVRRGTPIQALRDALTNMEQRGLVVRNRRGGYGSADKMDLVRGRVVGHPDGYGFLIPEEGGEDVFLSAREMRAVLHSDRAVVAVTGIDRRGRREGGVVEVLERNTHQLVGRFYKRSGVGFVVPDNKRISHEVVIPPENLTGAREGQIVVVAIIEQPSAFSQPVGRVVEVLGDHMAPGMEIETAIRSYELPHRWPRGVQREVDALSLEVSAEPGRVDLRELPLVTIDGADARDFDDAVYCEPRSTGWRLLVAIADVAWYVRPGSALDEEAVVRGNSVYFPGQVIPMLPEALSNGLCSLNPQVDRYCLACELLIDTDGRVVRSRFFAALMRSAARLTYEEVNALLAGEDSDLRHKRAALMPHLEALYAVYQALRGARERRGAIDFDTTETRIVFGEGRKIEKIVPIQRGEAHRLIEECMLAANMAAARTLLRHKLPTLFRVHDKPTDSKLTDLRAFLAEMGLSLGGADQPEAAHYAQLLERIRSRPDAHLIQTVMLRSFSQAVYAPENIGHFGLATDAYTHFTSPIRRYPDLIVHRGLRFILEGRDRQEYRYGFEDVAGFGDHCSMTERRADEATRDAVDWLKCEYMLDKVGEEFDGIVSAVTSFGLFVVLDEIYTEGLVHVTSLSNDYYHFDPVKHRLMGERTRRIYRLGDSVRIKVLRVDLDEKKMDFALADAAAGGGKRRTRRR